MTAPRNFPVTVTFNPNSKEVAVVPNRVHVNDRVATVTWTLQTPGASFDPTSGIAWNPGVVSPPGMPFRVSDTEWALNDVNTNDSNESFLYGYTVTVIAASGSHFKFDPEVSNDPTGGRPDSPGHGPHKR